MKKSIKIVGRKTDFAFVIRDVNIKQVTVEKWNVECRSDIADAWASNTETDGQLLPESEDQIIEIILKEKINNVTLDARPKVIELAAKNGGKIIKDINIDKTRQKSYLSELIFFKEAENI